MEEWTIRNLIDELNRLTILYDEGKPEVSNEYWDNLYFKLKKMEEKTGIVYPDSPTQNIYFEKISELKKVKHDHKMLSLDKTKDWNTFLTYFNNKDVIGMVKLDGLTCSLTYENGKLIKAETRGNGLVGEDILHNAKTLTSIPLSIPYKEKLVIDGEIICTSENFLNFSEEYANPRNFASGSIRLLDSKECKKRNLTFIVWNVVEGFNEENSFLQKLIGIEKLGFLIVPWTSNFDLDAKEFLIHQASKLGYPIDGLVGRFDDIKYGSSLGETSHHTNAAYAYKFYDETYPTRLKHIEWTMGRTGVLTPVAIFDPIDIDGSTVERASLHNVSIMKEILGDCAYVGEPLQVAKMNQIIPQIVEAGPKYNYGYVISQGGVSANDVIEKCPICGGDVSYIKSKDGVINVYCDNPLCEGKLINRLDHFCGKKGLDIKGLSKATFEKLIDWGWVNSIKDIFWLYNHQMEWMDKPGFGKASVFKILDAIENGKHTTLDAFISAIGIPLIGKAVAKDLANYFKTYDDFREAVKDDEYNFYALKNFGEEMHNSIKNFDYTEADEISKFLIIEAPVVDNNKINNSLTGKTFTITGKLSNFKNRAELKSIIESYGGKVSDTITNKTTALINNDINSSSSKNKTAKAKNIPIISELDFMRQYLEK